MRGRDEGGRDDQGTNGLEDQGTRGPKKEKISQKKKKKIPKINTSSFISVAYTHSHSSLKWLISWLSKLRSSMIFNCYLQIEAFQEKNLSWSSPSNRMRQRYLPPAGTDAPQPMANCPTSSARCFTAPWHQNETIDQADSDPTSNIQLSDRI